MEFLYYGEDALTLWTLTESLSDFLNQLGDSSDPENALVFYRPSFGRRSGSDDKPRSEFGEFDAIIGTEYSVYLVESKWSRSSELGESLTLREEQIRRHQIFHWYLKEWQASNATHWKYFKKSNDIAYSQKFKHSVLPPNDSALASNLEFVLNQLKPCGTLIQDVLLFIRIDEEQFPSSVEPAQFRLVTLSQTPIGGAGYIQLFKSK